MLCQALFSFFFADASTSGRKKLKKSKIGLTLAKKKHNMTAQAKQKLMIHYINITPRNFGNIAAAAIAGGCDVTTFLISTALASHRDKTDDLPVSESAQPTADEPHAPAPRPVATPRRAPQRAVTDGGLPPTQALAASVVADLLK